MAVLNTGDMIRLPHAEVTIEINDEAYTFVQAISIAVNDPRSVKLLASPQNRGNGLPVATGLTEQATVQSVVRDVPRGIQQLLSDAFNSLGTQRVKFTVIDLENFKTLSVTQGIVTDNPNNNTIDENDSTYDVPLNLGCTPNNLKNDFQD